MVDHLMPLIAPLKFLILTIGWNSEIIAPKLRIPVLYLAGKRDELVPHIQMQQLFKSTTKSRLPKIHVVEGGTHNETWIKGGQPYWDAMKLFIREALDSEGESLQMESSNVSAQPREPNDSGSSIPIMPRNLLGIAKESIRESNTDATMGKKEL
jgi:hypothetical protein